MVRPVQQWSLRRCKHICSPPRLQPRNNCKTSSLSTLSSPRGWPWTLQRCWQSTIWCQQGGTQSTPRAEQKQGTQGQDASPWPPAPLSAGTRSDRTEGARSPQTPEYTANPSQTVPCQSRREQGSLWCNEWGSDFTATPSPHSDQNSWQETSSLIPACGSRQHQPNNNLCSTAKTKLPSGISLLFCSHGKSKNTLHLPRQHYLCLQKTSGTKAEIHLHLKQWLTKHMLDYPTMPKTEQQTGRL